MRLIDVDGLLGILNDLAEGGAESIKISEIIYFLKRMPTRGGIPFDEPVRHGKWIKCIHHTYKAHTVKCSCCGGYALHDSDGYWVESNYCPHCNAKMG